MGHDGHHPRKDQDWATQLATIEPKALCHAKSILHPPEDAEDAVRDVIGRVMARGPFTPDTSLEAYVITAVTHRCVDKLRSRTRHLETSLTADDGSAIDLQDTHPDALTALLAEETRESIVSALDKLSPEYQELLHLRYFEDLTLQEISTLVALPVSTVHGHLNKALAQLAKILKRGGVHV